MTSANKNTVVTFQVRLLIAFLGIFLSTSAFAVTLQPLIIHSGFGVPLEAVISLNDTGRSRIRDIKVSFYDYRNVNTPIAVSNVLRRSTLSYKVVRDDDRNLAIQLSSDRAVQERRIAFTVEVTDRLGRTDKRRYLHVIQGTFVEDSNGGLSNQRIDRNTLAKETGKGYGLGLAYAGSFVSSSDYDNLWDMAMQVKAGYGFSVYQVMVAIFQANVAAFTEQNINNLLLGKQVYVPSFKEINRVDRSFAIREVAKMNYSVGGLPVQLAAIRDILRLIDVADVEETYADVEILEEAVVEEELPSWVDDAAVDEMEDLVSMPDAPEAIVEVEDTPLTIDTPSSVASSDDESQLFLYVGGLVAALLLLVVVVMYSRRGGSASKSTGAVQLSISDKLDLAEGYLRMNRQQDASNVIKEIEGSGSASTSESERLLLIKGRIDT